MQGVPQEIPREEALSAWCTGRRSWCGAALLVFVTFSVAAETTAEIERLRERGAYVLRASGCVACHTDEDNGGQFLAGGRAIETKFGTFYSPNITFDREQGIGAWKAEDFFRALRHGIAPDGTSYSPVFPYTAYTRMRREDMFALWVYLASVATSARKNTAHKLAWYVRPRIVNRVWKLLFFESGVFRPEPGRSEVWNRGAYLVKAMAHCGECHTPRTRFGALDETLAYAGAAKGPSSEGAPNITPDAETGIGRWSRSELVEYLSEGMLPDGDFAGGAMAEIIDSGLAYLKPRDLDAIAEFIMALPPIRHEADGPEG